MNYMNIKTCDIADGEGVRVTLFVSGCPLHCFNCQNKEAWNFDAGKLFTDDTLNYIIDKLRPDYINGFTLCGGEPLCPENIDEVKDILRIIKKYKPDKTIWCYTGYELDEICDKKVLDYIDVLITGRYVDSLRDISHNNEWRGSTNQKIIYLHKEE